MKFDMNIKNIRNVKFKNSTVRFSKFTPKKKIYEKFEKFFSK